MATVRTNDEIMLRGEVSHPDVIVIDKGEMSEPHSVRRPPHGKIFHPREIECAAAYDRNQIVRDHHPNKSLWHTPIHVYVLSCPSKPHTLMWSLLISFILAIQGATGIVAAWETEQQAAEQVRHLLSDPSQHYSQGILSSIFPSSYPDASLRHLPSSSAEYFAPCSSNGDLTLIALTVSSTWRNALTPGANVTFTIQSNPNPSVPDWRHLSSDRKWDENRPQWRKGMPSKLRFNLYGHVKVLQDADDIDNGQEPIPEAGCFLKLHPDARKWAPGAKASPHHAKWVRFVVEKIYATGGFGDEHRIGMIDRDVYAKASPKTISGSSSDGGFDNSNNNNNLFGDNDQQQQQEEEEEASLRQSGTYIEI
ncbi:unnamed protein product [Sympodiomycopsis kandeliae]